MSMPHIISSGGGISPMSPMPGIPWANCCCMASKVPGVGCRSPFRVLFARYSSVQLMYIATKPPTRLATTQFLWKIMQVAMTRPAYVKYLVLSMVKSLPAFLSATHPSFFPFLNPFAHSKQLSGPSDSHPLQALSQAMHLKDPSVLTQNLF